MKHLWEWPIASYLFLGGLGGGALFMVGILTLVLGFSGSGSVAGVFVALLALGLGCFFLVFELGQWTKAPRVVLSSTAIIKWGAVLLTIAMVAAFFYCICYLPGMPGDAARSITNPLIGIAMIAGLCVCIYTGVLLATLKGHAFWNSPALPVLFTISALSTGCALVSLTFGLWPVEASIESVLSIAVQHGIVHMVDVVLVAAEIIVLIGYVLMMATSSNVTAKEVAMRWLTGSFAKWFWLGMVGAGLVIPFIMYQTEGVLSTLIAPILILASGLLLRFLVVYSNDRAFVPGERRYYEQLPKGDEEFLHTWKQGENWY